MTTKQFCLKWNNFQSNILNAFESLQNTEDLTDVTLTCEGINVKAHKFILSACSPYFRTVFKENPCSHPIIILKDVLYTDLIAIINFMYHGEVLVCEEQLATFLQTAKLLQVSGLNNSSDNTSRRFPPTPPKKVRKFAEISPESPIKKAKLCQKPKVSKVCANNNDSNTETSPLNLESDKIKPDLDEPVADVNENLESVSLEKSEQCSILEAALDPGKPGSILERSLISQTYSVLSVPTKQNYLTAIEPPGGGGGGGGDQLTKIGIIPRKPIDNSDLNEKKIRSTSSGSSSPSALFDRPTTEFLQQTIKIEEDSYDSSETTITENQSSKDVQFQLQCGRNLDIQQQPHHSSQCGNCPHCGKVYSNQSALKYHVRLMHSDLTNMYCCHLCPEAFDYREGYKKHMVEVHCVRN